jgi:hypothetical protein
MSAAAKVSPIRIVNGFTAQLPGRTRVFFQRVYFAQMPRPIQVGLGNPYPFGINVATIEAPAQQCIILRSASFKIFQHSGIGVDDFIEVNPSRAASTFGFSLRIGNRGLTDFNTNNSPDPGQAGAVTSGIKVGVGQAALSPGDGRLYPFAGRITPSPDTDPFASYVRPAEQLFASVTVLREPNYDVRFFSVELSGWLANEAELDKMINSLSG